MPLLVAWMVGVGVNLRCCLLLGFIILLGFSLKVEDLGVWPDGFA